MSTVSDNNCGSLSSLSSEDNDVRMADKVPQRLATTGETGIPPSPPGHMMDSYSIRSQPCSIDQRPSQTAFLLGDTGESDPYLVQHSALLVDAGAQDSDSKISYLKVRHRRPPSDDTAFAEDDDRPLIFMFIDHSLHARYEPRVDDESLRRAHKDLDQMCNLEVGTRLVKLFFKYVYPYWPILSRSKMLASDSTLSTTVASLPLSLRAALYATGLPFMIYDDVLATKLDLSTLSAGHLYRICWLAITDEIHHPHLSTLQACLLLLQRANDDRYVMDSPFRWSLLAWTVSLAQSLGLSTDCSHWLDLPAWEKRLRRRLWWAVYVMDKWSFPSAGLATHIKREDFDVLPLTAKDFVSAELMGADASPRDTTTGADGGGGGGETDILEDSHFYHLVELSCILSDVLDSFFTIRASNSTRCHFSRTIELARPLRTQLQRWKESFDQFIARRRPSDSRRAPSRLDGNVSLGLAYPIAVMILFRAILRPLQSSTSVTPEDFQIREDGRAAVRAGAKACCVEVVQYVEQVQRGAWDAFWHSCKSLSESSYQYSFIELRHCVGSRANFAIASSFMMRLLLTSTSTSETDELNHLITRWRWALRTGGGNAGNVLTSLGLLRLDRSLLRSGVRIGQDEDDDNALG